MSEPSPPQSPGAPAADHPGQAYNPDDYQWVPVLRKPRADGWTPQRQVEFIAALADSGCVEQAAQAVGISVNSCYRLRRSPGAERFAAAWDAALGQAARRLVDIAFSPSTAPTSRSSIVRVVASGGAFARMIGC